MNDVHYKYWIGILISLFVAISTTKVGANDNLVQYLGFAVGLSSLILSVLAIGLTIAGSMDFTRNIGKLDSSATAAVRATTAFETSSKNIIENLERVSSKVANMEIAIQKQSEVSQEIKDITSRFLRTSPDNITENKSPSSINWDDWINITSMSGLFLLYAVRGSFDKSEEFDLEKFASNLSVSSEYFHGYMIACNSANVIHTDYSKENPKVYKITRADIPEKDILMREIEKRLENEKDDESFKKYLSERIVILKGL